MIRPLYDDMCCLLVLDSLTSTPQWIRQTKPRVYLQEGTYHKRLFRGPSVVRGGTFRLGCGGGNINSAQRSHNPVCVFKQEREEGCTIWMWYKGYKVMCKGNKVIAKRTS